MTQEIFIEFDKFYKIIGIGFEIEKSFNRSEKTTFSAVNEDLQQNCSNFTGEINVSQKTQLMFPCSSELIAKYIHIRSEDGININLCNVNVLVKDSYQKNGKSLIN